MTPPELSIVSLTWNSERFVEPYLRTLLKDASDASVPVEVIVVDNGSRDGTLQMLQEFEAKDERVRIVPLSTNQGTTAPRNIGVRMARGRYVLILDSDTEIPPGTLKALLALRDDLPDPDNVGMICPKLVYPDGEFQESARRFPTLFTKVYRLFHLEERRAKDESVPAVIEGKVTLVDYAISAAWLIPRETFERVGYLDEAIFYAPEDVEYCARIWQRGLKIWYHPGATIVHNCQRITNKKPLGRLGLSHAKGLVRYWWKYQMFFSRPDLDA